MAQLERLLESRSGTRRRQDGSIAPLDLAVACSLWGQHDTRWNESFLRRLDETYAGELRRVDYVADAEGARVRINGWTSEQTHARIPELIGTGILDLDTRLVLVNAVYLKAPWEHPFRAAMTQPRRFTRRDGSTVQAPTMSLRIAPDDASAGTRPRYAQGDGWQAAELSYAGSELAMTVVLPERGRLEQVERAVAAGVLRRAVRALEPVPALEVRLPKWTFRTARSLKDPLSALGMPTAFDDRAADFGGMTDEDRLFISHVLHEAFVAVDEEGTEAAAATAVVMRRTSAGPPPPKPVVLHVDRPFFFVIHDVGSRTPVFVGRVDDPTT
jgi:serpin B